MPEPEEWMKPSETRDFILKHFGKKILVDGSKRPLERIKAAKRIRSDYTAAGITKICKFLKG
jgi:CII-binding regulator of phage lambda lysogenization HflD